MGGLGYFICKRCIHSTIKYSICRLLWTRGMEGLQSPSDRNPNRMAFKSRELHKKSVPDAL